jgi:hypothetical protein
VSVEFDPIKLGPRRRRVDPMVVGILVVVVALALAIVKPWDPAEPSIAAGPSAVVAQVPPPTPRDTPSASRAATPPASATPRPSPSPSWADIAPVVGVHRAWGAEAVLLPAAAVSPGRSDRFVASWSAVAAGPDGPQTAYIARDDQSIVALGITYPANEVPADARIWLVHAGDQLEWMDARLVLGGAPDGALLFERRATSGAGPSSWPGGHYRIDVLLAGGVRRITIRIPDRLGSVASPDPWPVTALPLVAPDASDPSSVHVGLFATMNGKGIPLGATPGPSLDEATEWGLAAAPAPPKSGGPIVARAYLPLATGLGVMLTPHARLSSLSIRRLAPDPGFEPGPIVGGLSRLEGRTPFVIVAPVAGGAIPPGVYAVSIAWTDALGHHAGSWYVELRPGPIDPLGGAEG